MYALSGALCVVLAGVLLAGPTVAKEVTPPVLWWNDPIIVEQVGLTDVQRQKMDAAWDVYQKKIAPIREARASQREFVEALEQGDFERGRKLLAQWVEADQTPRRAMAELKLDVLPLLASEQRVSLVKTYPRLIRRNWAPALVWGAGPHAAPGPPRRPDGKPRGVPKP